MRGKQKFNMAKYPLNLLRIRIYKSSGDLLFKRPMWLIVSGKEREQLSLPEIYTIYRQRFDIEHFFRFSKDKLLMNKTQTPELEREEAWWQFVMIAYTQLYMSRTLSDNIPNPWEKYLSSFKKEYIEKSPTQTQKCFERIIRDIGTLAKPPKPRKKSLGRNQGEVQIKRQRLDVIIKSKKTENISAMVT